MTSAAQARGISVGCDAASAHAADASENLQTAKISISIQ